MSRQYQTIPDGREEIRHADGHKEDDGQHVGQNSSNLNHIQSVCFRFFLFSLPAFFSEKLSGEAFQTEKSCNLGWRNAALEFHLW